MLLPLMAAAFAAEPTTSVISKSIDNDVKGIERELVPLVQAMPADKFEFAPTHGAFTGVRTFRQQAMHVAYELYVIGAGLLAEPVPTKSGPDENGPADIKTKDDVVKYLQDGFAYAHKAIATITDRNATELIKSPFGDKQVPRITVATIFAWHSFDHYGQMVVYARMNGIVPPASRH